MDLVQSGRLLSERTQEYLKMLYFQAKISGSVQINFMAAKLGVPFSSAAKTAQLLQQSGFVVYEKYGRITLTDAGRQYVDSILKHENRPKTLQNNP